MADQAIETPEKYSAQVRNALLKGFAIPVALVVFFALAPAWLNHNLHKSVREAIAEDRRLNSAEQVERQAAFAAIDFAQVCRSSDPELGGLRRNLEGAGFCAQFTRLRWGQALSVGLVGLLVVFSLAIILLNQRAQRSRDGLISSFRTAWKLSVTTALVKVLLLIPLLSYGIFELTTLSMQRYSPKLIIIIVLGGVYALWRGFKILLRSVPLEFTEELSRTVTPEEAPKLWADVLRAAERVGTNPPDHILIGMDFNFYVTELAVNFGKGRAEGRTLYLSLPLMRQLGTDEVMAIVGHELGHFRGDDTRLTREFYPLRLKARETLQAMASSGWVGWPSLHALLFFYWSFARTEQTESRNREFLADRVGADLTSAEVAGRALVKVQVLSEAFNQSVGRAGEQSEGDIFARPLLPFIQTELAQRKDFWAGLLARNTPHPLDSHPPLRLRLESLGQLADPESAARVVLNETTPAFATWFDNSGDLFAEITAQANDQIVRYRTRMKAAAADIATDEGRKLLETHFPEVRWTGRAIALWVKFCACIVGALLCLGFVFVIPQPAGKAAMLGLSVVFAAWAVQQWKRHSGGEFILKADGLYYSGWVRPLLFENVQNIRTVSTNGALTVVFFLKQAQPNIWKYSPLRRVKAKKVSLQLGLIKGKQQEVAQTIYNYLTRNMAV